MSTPTTPTPTPSTRASEGGRARGDRDGPRSDARERALARAIDPVAPETFFEEHWERSPLHVARAGDARFDDLLSRDDAERLVCSTGLRFPAFRLVKAGGKLDPRDYTFDIPWRPAPFAGSVDVERVLAEFEAGATIVLQGLHLHWPPLAAYCRDLEALLGHPAQANAYYTPRRSQGLPVHHDTHDVLVLQVAGEKRWRVYEPVLPLPLKEQRYSPELGEPGPLVQDLTLEPGDTLYLPRGWLHEALTSESDSLHLTIGVNVHTWVDAFRAALAACEEDVEFRRRVPPDGASDVDLVERLRARLAPEEVAARMRRRFVDTRRPILEGQLTQLRAVDELTLETLLERRPTVIADLALRDGAVSLAFEGKEVVFPAHAAPEVGYVVTAPAPFRPRDLPGSLDDEGRIVLARRLVREGFLRATDARARGTPS